MLIMVVGSTPHDQKPLPYRDLHRLTPCHGPRTLELIGTDPGTGKEMIMESLALLVHRSTIANGGCTATASGEIVSSGYAVAGIAPATRIAIHAFTPERLEEILAAINSEFIGTWIENDEVWIEPTTIIADGEIARRVAEERKEIALFHLDTATEIRL